MPPRLRLRATIYQNVPKIIGSVTIILGVIGIPALVTTNTYVRAIAIAIFCTAFLLGILCTISADISERIADAISAIATANSKTLQEQKNELANELRKLNQNVLIIMDDIDRLTPNETANLFQLVKTNGDFPKIIYLLLCQRDTVEHALKIALELDGKQYLKKIVNVGFDIPIPRMVKKLERAEKP
jgi:KAP family P-loop domain